MVREPLRKVAGQLGVAEALLDLVVDESDEGVVLLAQLLPEDAVVLLADPFVLLLREDKVIKVVNDGRSCADLPCICARK